MSVPRIMLGCYHLLHKGTILNNAKVVKKRARNRIKSSLHVTCFRIQMIKSLCIYKRNYTNIGIKASSTFMLGYSMYAICE